MALTATQFQQFASTFVDDMQALTQAVETWAGNKADANPNFDFTSAHNALQTAKTNYMTAVQAVIAT